MTASRSSYEAALQEYLLKRNTIKPMAYRNRPWLGMVPKDLKAYGEHAVIYCDVEDPRGGSATFATAQSAQLDSVNRAFHVVPDTQHFEFAKFTHDLLMASTGNSWRRAKQEVDGAINRSSDVLAASLFRDSAKTLGRISSSSDVTTTTITLTEAADALNFYPGQVIVLCSSNTSGTVRSGTATVDSVDEDTYQVTFTAALTSGIAAAAASDYIFTSGDQTAGSSLSITVGLSGIPAWIPDDAPGATTFHNVDRSGYPIRLGGHRMGGQNISIEEACLRMCARVQRTGGKVDTIVMGTNKFVDFQMELSSQRRFLDGGTRNVDVKGPGKVVTIGYDGIKLANGAMVFADPFCKESRAYCLEKDSWLLLSTGEAPHVQNDDGQILDRVYNANAREARISWYAELACMYPGHNGVIKFDSNYSA